MRAWKSQSSNDYFCLFQMNCSLFKINLLQEFAPKGGQFEVLKESDFLVHSRVISQEDIRKHEILNLGL